MRDCRLVYQYATEVTAAAAGTETAEVVEAGLFAVFTVATSKAAKRAPEPGCLACMVDRSAE